MSSERKLLDDLVYGKCFNMKLESNGRTDRQTVNRTVSAAAVKSHVVWKMV